MELKKNAFGDYLIYENGKDKGYTLKILGSYRVFDKKGNIIGCISKSDNEYFAYDVMDNFLESGDFETLVFNFLNKKRAELSAL